MDVIKSDVAWAAGLFEGEGCISWVNRKLKTGTPNHVCTVSIRMTDADIVQRFHKIVGIGRIHGPYKGATEKHKPYTMWLAESFENTQHIVALFWPWLGNRRRAKAREVLTLEKKERPNGRGTRRDHRSGRFTM